MQSSGRTGRVAVVVVEAAAVAAVAGSIIFGDVKIVGRRKGKKKKRRRVCVCRLGNWTRVVGVNPKGALEIALSFFSFFFLVAPGL